MFTAAFLSYTQDLQRYFFQIFNHRDSMNMINCQKQLRNLHQTSIPCGLSWIIVFVFFINICISR